MLSLEEKVKIAKESSSIEKKQEELFYKLSKDKKFCIWHLSETKEITEKQFKNLKDKSSPLYGLTLGVKDLFMVKGTRTTAGSKILKDFIAPYDSTVYKSLIDKGAIFACKTSMDEFAMGSYTNTSFYGKTLHPKSDEHTAGGSSGGSAVAVALDLVDFSIGSDTGGSVRQPASYCSIIGFKPSYGAFSRYGMISYASSLDQAGFFTKTIDDLQYLLKSDIADKDYFDPTSIGLGKYKVKDKSEISVSIMPKLLEHSGLDDVAKESYKKTIEQFKKTGIKLVEVDLPLMDLAAQIYYVIACSEASSNLARYQGVYFGTPQDNLQIKSDSFWNSTAQYRSELFGQEVQRRIMLGSAMLSSENFKEVYQKSWDLRKLLTYQIEEKLKVTDMLCIPTACSGALKFSDIDKMTPAQIYISDFLTVGFSLAGLPCLSTPIDKNEFGVSMQFVGKKFDDYQLVSDVKSILEKTK